MTKTIVILIARLIFAAAFLMAAGFKFADMAATAEYIASEGFPFPLFLAWTATFFELALVLGFLTGAFFSEAALVAAAYVLFLGFVFHGPEHWQGNQMEFGFFVAHFTFLAGLLFAAVHGPDKALALRWHVLAWRNDAARATWPSRGGHLTHAGSCKIRRRRTAPKQQVPKFLQPHRCGCHQGLGSNAMTVALYGHPFASFVWKPLVASLALSERSEGPLKN